MKGKLCQVIALANGAKTHAEGEITKIHRATEKDTLLVGFDKNYQKKDDNGDQQPSERKVVQVRVPEQMEEAKKILADLWRKVCTQDVGNTKAKADVVLLDGTVLATAVPVCHLLFLEKQLENAKKLIGSLTVLDSSIEWRYNRNKDVYESVRAAETLSTKKTTVPLVLTPATDKHPAQVAQITQDIVVGTWATMHYSGGIPAKDKKMALERVRQVQDAVKSARELANQQDVEDVNVASKLLDYVFDDLISVTEVAVKSA